MRKLLGIHVEEFDPWTEEMRNAVVIEEGLLKGVYSATLWGEVVQLEGARALGIFASGYYADGPALTLHQFGQGQTYYLATQVSDDLLAALMGQLCREVAASPVLEVPEGVEATWRECADGRALYFLLNHTEKAEQVSLPAGTFSSLLSGEKIEGQLEVAARDVAVLLAG